MEDLGKNIKEDILILNDYFKSHAYKTICIYGYGEGGKRIKYSLEKEGCKIEYAVDRVATSDEIKIYRPNNKLPDVDAMVICVKRTKQDILNELTYSFSGEIIEMRQIMEEVSFPDK